MCSPGDCTPTRPAMRNLGPAFPLAIANTGDGVECVDVVGGAGVRRHMAALGILPGTPLLVVSGGNAPGPVIVKRGDGKLMIGRGMAHRIMVRALPGR